MNTNSLVGPLLGLVMLITGCGKTEIEYHHSSKAKVVDAPKHTEEGNHRRHELSEANQTTFRIAVDGRSPEEPQATKPLESASAPSRDIRADSKSLVSVDVGTINIHVGDVHHHTHVNTTTVVHAPQQKSLDQETIREPNRSTKPTTPTKNERCERLRREYEARQAQWNRLFNRR